MFKWSLKLYISLTRMPRVDRTSSSPRFTPAFTSISPCAETGQEYRRIKYRRTYHRTWSAEYGELREIRERLIVQHVDKCRPTNRSEAVHTANRQLSWMLACSNATRCLQWRINTTYSLIQQFSYRYKQINNCYRVDFHPVWLMMKNGCCAKSKSADSRLFFVYIYCLYRLFVIFNSIVEGKLKVEGVQKVCVLNKMG